MVKNRKLVWLSTIVLVVFHLGAIAALFMFSWKALAAMAFLYWVSGGLGICMGYHRLHTHRSFHVPDWVAYALATCGSLAFEGGPISWTGNHRLHHKYSDQPGDPHSSREGFFWAHLGWIIYGAAGHNATVKYSKYTPDLAKHRYYVWLNDYHWVPTVVVAAILYLMGGLPFVMWGIFMRVTLCFHATWCVNSAAHLWGKRRFATGDDSRNLWWLALITFGEGWHNNHHAHPTSARHGLAWYELDIAYLQIRFLKMLGLARGVRVASLDSAMPTVAAQAPVPELVGAE
jgi:stearoyl-CoA desaturase (delta-9 desaturase)